MSREATKRGCEDQSWYTAYDITGVEVDIDLDALGGDAVVVDHSQVDIVLED